MFFLAFFIMILLLLIIFCFLRLSLKLSASVDGEGFHMDVRIMLYHFLTLYKWDFKEGGASFLLKKKRQMPDERKKKKGRLTGTFETLFSKDTFKRLGKSIQVFDVSVKGRIATKDAAATALIFGNIWSILGALAPFIPQKRLSLDFYPDFQKDTPDFHISCILRVRIIHIIMLIAENKCKKLRKGRSESYGTASY